MKYCPNAECGHRTRTGQAAEYLDRITACAECGATLVDGAAPLNRERGVLLAATSRLLVTVAAVIVASAARRWTLEVGDTHILPLRLGLGPAVAAFIGVELATRLVPRLRAWRSRAHWRPVAWALALPLALVAAVATASPLPPSVQAPAVALWVGGAVALVGVAELVDRLGIGSGYAVVVAAGVLPAVHDLGTVALRATTRDQTVLAAVVLLSVVFATRMILRAHEKGGPRLPTCGILPLDAVGFLFALPAALHTPALAGQGLGFGVSLGVTGVVTAVCAILLGRLFSAGAATDARAAALASVRSVLFVGALFAAGVLLSTLRVPMPGVYLVVMATAVTLDIFREWRARGEDSDWRQVAELVSVHQVDHTVGLLTDAGIPAFVRGVGFRSLVHVFGPFAPLDVWVPARELRRARDLVCTDADLG